MNKPRLALVLGGLCLACSGEPLTEGLEEPLRVHNAQFRKGALPGVPQAQDAENTPASPYATSTEVNNLVAAQGYPGKKLRGRATGDAASVAVRFADVGTGYWLFSVGAQDPAFNNEYLWEAVLDIGANVAPGYHDLQVAILDPNGNAGTQSILPLCVTDRVPDNLSSCVPSNAPPSAVISLSWDSAVDLDLRVYTPSGKIVDAKHPSTSAADAGATLPSGVVDRDSNANCNIDGYNRESLVFQDAPEPGNYYIYANLYDACGQASVRFEASLHQAVAGDTPDVLVQRQTLSKSGSLLAVDANGGARVGLYVASFSVQ